MESFYRYVRPVKFNPLRMEVITQPHGGICLRFEAHNTRGEDSSQYLWFTFARCHDEDLFSRGVAKRIVDGRAQNLIDLDIPSTLLVGKFKYTNNTQVLYQEVIDFCSSPNLNPNDSPKVQYLQSDMLDLGTALRNLIRSNEIEEEKAMHFKEAIAATQTSQRYANASR